MPNVSSAPVSWLNPIKGFVLSSRYGPPVTYHIIHRIQKPKNTFRKNPLTVPGFGSLAVSLISDSIPLLLAGGAKMRASSADCFFLYGAFASAGKACRFAP